jgi:hypothetical protein
VTTGSGARTDDGFGTVVATPEPLPTNHDGRLTTAARHLYGQLVAWCRDHRARDVPPEAVEAMVAGYPDRALITISVAAGVDPDDVDVSEAVALQLVGAGLLAITEAGWRLMATSHGARQRRYRARRRAQRDAGGDARGDAAVTPGATPGDAPLVSPPRRPATRSAGDPRLGGSEHQLDLNQVLAANGGA